ncbi:MAG: hypothetical protein LH615_06785, partial [Ferruginibacter sp.]|nr:hypothetical protein [Ferruginibacter sp.]
MKKARLISFILFLLVIQSLQIKAQSANSQLKGKKKSVKSSARKTEAKVYFVMQKTTGGRDSIVKPPVGMIIFNTTLNNAQRYTGNAWKKLNANERYIGEEFAGGIVLYLDSTKAHGLIVTPANQSPSAQWGFFKE